MVIDTETVSLWFVRLKGFKVYASCPSCSGSNVMYQKARKVGYHGFAAQCRDCEHRMPVRLKHHFKRKTRQCLPMGSEDNVIYVDFRELADPEVKVN